MKVRVWSNGLDLWGSINQMNEKVDPQWFFPTCVSEKNEENELISTISILQEMGELH